jgi:hypothetical protein
MEEQDMNATPHTAMPEGETAPSPSSTQAEETSGAAQSDPGFEQLMEASPMLSPLAGWVKCLRRSGISVEYSFRKRHVPDMEQEGGAGSSGTPDVTGAAGTSLSQGKGDTAKPASSPSSKGKNSDEMGVNGHFTIRYFDFALGVLGLAIAGCMAKSCCALKRYMS